MAQVSLDSGTKSRPIRRYSRAKTVGRVDQRTRQAKLMRRVRDELTAHLGGAPTNIQKLMIERCVWLSLRLGMFDEMIAKGEEFTIHDSNYYIAWSNSLVRTLGKLGINEQPASVTAPSKHSAIKHIMAEANAAD